MDPKSIISLGSKLLDIDEERFRQVVTLLEQISEHMEVQETLSIIRPRLVELRPKRLPTFKRRFCEPFEDLFDAPSGNQPAPLNKVDRAVVNILWPLVESQIGRDRLRDYAGALENGAQRIDPCRAFWIAAAATVTAIRAQLEAGRFDDAFDLRLNPDRIRTIQDIEQALSIAAAVDEMKATLSPKPLAKLHRDHLEAIQTVGRKVARSRPEALKIFILLAAARLGDPSLLLGGLWDMDFGQTAAERAALFLELSATVVAHIEERSGGGAAANSDGTTDRLAVADLAVDLVASLEATRSAMEYSRNKDFDQRLKVIRESVHQMVRSQVLDGAETHILTALDTGVPGGQSRERMLSAESQARALRKCSTIADTLGLRGEIRTVTAKTTDSLTDTARSALRGGDGDPRTGYTAIRMIELISGPAHANEVMDKILQRAGR